MKSLIVPMLLIPLGFSVVAHASQTDKLNDALLARTAQMNALNHQWQTDQQAMAKALLADDAMLDEKLAQANSQLTELKQVLDRAQSRLHTLEKAEATHKKDKDLLEASLLQLDQLLAAHPLYRGDTQLNATTSSSALSQQGMEQSVQAAFSQIDKSGQITQSRLTLYSPDGQPKPMEVLSVGGLVNIASMPKVGWGWVLPKDGELHWQPAGEQTPIIEEFVEAKSTHLPLDVAGSELAGRAQAQTLADWFRQGGLLLWPLVALFTVGLGLILWRAVALFGYKPTLAPDFGAQDLTRTALIAYYQSQPGTLGKAIAAVLGQHLPTNAMEQALQAIYLTQSRTLERGLGFIALLAALAPMLGLLGTVTGMMTTFQQLTWFGNANPQLLSGGISVALITTQAGLIFALPLLLLHYPLKRRAQALCIDIEAQLISLVATLSRLDKTRPELINGETK